MKKAMTKAQKIKAMIELNKTNAEIVNAVPTATLQQIYNHRYIMKKKYAKADKIKDAYRKKHPKIIEAWNKVADATPKEEEAWNIDAHSSGHQFDMPNANAVQVGGEHYKTKNIQPWDAIHAWGLGFFSGNVVKYVARHREKNGVEDLKKARHYLDKLIEIMEAK